MSAHFTYYGKTEDKNREVRFYKRPNGLYVCEVEGMPVLRITHPSKTRVMAAFKGWWEMSQKDWGASEIDWNEMATPEEQEEDLWKQLDQKEAK